MPRLHAICRIYCTVQLHFVTVRALFWTGRVDKLLCFINTDSNAHAPSLHVRLPAPPSDGETESGVTWALEPITNKVYKRTTMPHLTLARPSPKTENKCVLLYYSSMHSPLAMALPQLPPSILATPTSFLDCSVDVSLSSISPYQNNSTLSKWIYRANDCRKQLNPSRYLHVI